eukprot:Partr_v1_DN28738_c2_g1_i1_m62145 putative ankyrin repeat protein
MEEEDNIWIAASDGNLEVVRHHIEANGQDINAQDEFGYTPLLAAVSYNHRELVAWLLANSADISVADHDGSTVMHYCEEPSMARYLIEMGADPLVRNVEDMLAIQVHYDDGNMEMVEFLREFSPDIHLSDASDDDNDDEGSGDDHRRVDEESEEPHSSNIEHIEHSFRDEDDDDSPASGSRTSDDTSDDRPSRATRPIVVQKVFEDGDGPLR